MWCKYIFKQRTITLSKIRKFHLISWCGNFADNYLRNKMMTNINISLKNEILVIAIIMILTTGDFKHLNVNWDVIMNII